MVRTAAIPGLLEQVRRQVPLAVVRQHDHDCLAGVLASAALQVAGGARSPVLLFWRSLPGLAPLWLVVVGAARRVDVRTRRRALAVLPAGAAVTLALQYPLTAPIGRTFLLLPIVLVVYAVAAGVTGLPLLVLGAVVPVEEVDSGHDGPGADRQVGAVDPTRSGR